MIDDPDIITFPCLLWWYNKQNQIGQVLKLHLYLSKKNCISTYSCKYCIFLLAFSPNVSLPPKKSIVYCEWIVLLLSTGIGAIVPPTQNIFKILSQLQRNFHLNDLVSNALKSMYYEIISHVQ